MPTQIRQPSYAECVTRALSESPVPLSVDELMRQIGAQREVGAGARSAIYRAINKLFQAVQVEQGVFGWLSHLLQDNQFRHQLATEETRRGYILLDELEHIVFYPEFFQRYRPEARRVRVDLFGGPTLTGEAAIERKTWSLRLGVGLSRWIDDLGGQSGDDLIITVIDAFKGHYSLRLQPHEIRDEAAIRQRNIQLADVAEELVTEDRRTRPAIPAWELAAKLIGRRLFTQQPAVDDLHYVLHEYSALRLVDGLGYQLDFGSANVPHARRFDSDLLQDVPDELPARKDYSKLSDYSKSGRAFSSGNSDDDGSEDRPEEYEEFVEMFDNSNPEGFNPESDGHKPEDYESDDYEPYNNLADDNADDCEIYSQYLQIFQEHRRNGEAPLDHEDFHLLEAELEMLVRLEQEFGRLLSDQERRKLDLADQLFIDPNSLADIDWDMSDGEDYEDPPFWQN